MRNMHLWEGCWDDEVKIAYKYKNTNNKKNRQNYEVYVEIVKKI